MSNLILPTSMTQTQAHVTTSGKYQFVKTTDLVSRLESSGLVVRQAVQARSKKYDGYQKHVVRMAMPDIKVGDTMPEIMIVNSHNGSGSLQLRLGLYRMVCSNGLMVGSDIGQVRVRHQGNNIGKIVEDALDDLHTQLPFVAETIASMRGTNMSTAAMAEFVRKALDLRGVPATAVKKEIVPHILTAVGAARRQDDAGSSLWEVFNRTQENLIRGTFGLRKITSPTRDIELNRNLWNLAETFIKAA